MRETSVLGISLGNNTSACVVDPLMGVVFAISEERLTNEKNTKAFPINAIRECLNFIPAGNSIDVMLSHYEVANVRSTKYIEDLLPSDLVAGDFYATLKNYLARKLFVDPELIRIRRAQHHESHRLAGLLLSGFLMDKAKTYSITYDGFGDGLCGTIVDNTTDEILSMVEPRHSVGLVYQFVTGALGFKEHQHEGKITGLAAFGKPIYYDEFVEYLFSFDPTIKNFVSNYDEKDMALFDELNANIHQFMEFLALRKAVINLVDYLKRERGATKEDIAASVQFFAETMITEWVSCILNHPYNGGPYLPPFNIVLSGGLFANVKINYRIKEVMKPKQLFVLPPMGDEGNCIGAGIVGIVNNWGRSSIDLAAFGRDVLYRGTYEDRLSHEDILDLIDLEKYNLYTLSSCAPMEYFEVSEDGLYDMLTDLLRDEKILCSSRGDSEFGPRALGNHTIFYDCCKKETNQWLNGRLNRTEFMPFAPIVAVDFAHDLFHHIEGLEKTLKYMTIAVPVKEEFADRYKAAYHIDYTARPQVISESDNPFVYGLCKAYHEKTGKKALINTSFNIHNFPIIASDTIAVKSFLQADLDALLLQDVLIVKR